ncbi:MAG: dimethylsulfoniopropionate demethylase [Aestuariivita sp.]|nr:dimethylsulfoniopropionate demethylase [Aestuariivita sp.]
MSLMTASCRLRRTPFSQNVDNAGAKAFTVYNRMLLPTFFESIEADYHHLKSHVQLWDVSCQRQVEIRGPDASHLMQLLTPRNISSMMSGQCRYVPIVDDAGGMLNDPVALKLLDDLWWLSISDSDLLLWVKAIAIGFGLNVIVDEPDVSPLAVQGPTSKKLVERVFGSKINDIRFFGFDIFSFMGQDLIVSRSGYSKQGGFEIYLADYSLGTSLWSTLFEAGADLDVRAGCPNLIDRVEAGLLSYGGDMTSDNSPYECGLGKYCQPEEIKNCIGREALIKKSKEEPIRQIRPLEIAGSKVPICAEAWPLIKNHQRVGQVTAAVWSPDFETNVAIGMVDQEYWASGTELIVETPQDARSAIVRSSFWS